MTQQKAGIIDFAIRLIDSTDALSIAMLHTESWRSAYRGILSDKYLDDVAEAERRTYWSEKLAVTTSGEFGLLLTVNDEPSGFAFVVADDDRAFGNLLDNLHVLPRCKGRGLGRALMARIAEELDRRGWGQQMFLWVYEDNATARKFYERLGGRAVERISKTTLDDRQAFQWRYAWDDLRSCVAAK